MNKNYNWTARYDENNNYIVNFGNNDIVAKFGDCGWVSLKGVVVLSGKKVVGKIQDVAITFKGLERPMFMYLLDDGNYWKEDELDFADMESDHILVSDLGF